MSPLRTCRGKERVLAECPDGTPYHKPSYSIPDGGYELYELSSPHEWDLPCVFALAKEGNRGKLFFSLVG